MKEAKNDIAIVGIACNFPGAGNYNEYWENILNEKNTVRDIKLKRKNLGQYYHPDTSADNFISGKWIGAVDDIFGFDNEFFNISPREAYLMDPQQRILLQEAYHCIEDSNIHVEWLRKKTTSVFVGASTVDYSSAVYDTKEEIDSYALSSSYLSSLSNRISYFFGFGGKSLTIDTACASSLVALNEAKDDLLLKRSDYTIAAGVHFAFDEARYISLSKARVISPEGKCKVFSCDADGFVPGEGVGVLLLQRLEDAEKDNNKIYGVLKGGIVNHIGHNQTLTAPSIQQQKKCITQAWEDAGIAPEKVSYIETHGTGTFLGDPIEVEALKRAFGEYTDKKSFCYIGSVKSNIGHLECASGIASVIKVLMMMKHRILPKTLHISELNPVMGIENSALKISDKTLEWKNGREARVAGVTSIGLTGVNAHMVIQEYKRNKRIAKTMQKDDTWYPFLVSAKHENALSQWTNEFKKEINEYEQVPFRNLCLSTVLLKEQFKYRLGGLVNSMGDIRELLKDGKWGKAETKQWNLHVDELNLTGFEQIKAQGAHLEMLLQEIRQQLLFLTKEKQEDFYKAVWEKSNKVLFEYIITYCEVTVLKKLGVDIKSISANGNSIYAMLALSGMAESKEVIGYILDNTCKLTLKNPNMIVYDNANQMSLYPLHISKNAVLKLITSIEDSKKVEKSNMSYLLYKSRLMYRNQYSYRMIINDFALVCKNSEYDKCIQTIMNENNKHSEVFNTQEELFCIAIILFAIEKVNQKWNLKEEHQQNHPVIKQLVQYLTLGILEYADFAALFSMTEGEKLCDDMANRSHGITFKQMQDVGMEAESLMFIKNEHEWVERCRTTRSPALHNEKQEHIVCCAEDMSGGGFSFVPGQDLKSLLVLLWQEGADIRWQSYYEKEIFDKVDLPQYCFQKTYFNIYTDKTPRYSPDNDRYYFFKKSWVLDETPAVVSEKRAANVVILANAFSRHLAEAYLEGGHVSGKVIIMDQVQNEKQLNEMFQSSIALVDGIIDLSDLTDEQCHEIKVSEFRIKILQACLEKNKDKVRIEHFTKGLVDFQSNTVNLSGAGMAGFYRTMAAENDRIQSKTIDVDLDLMDHIEDFTGVIDTEWDVLQGNTEICYRNRMRYHSTLAPTDNQNGIESAEKTVDEPAQFVLITGGTRGLGAEVARKMVGEGTKKLILTGRRPIPPQSEWDGILNGDGDPLIQETIRLVKELEEMGAEVSLCHIHLSDQEEMAAYLGLMEKRWGPVEGVVHCAGVLANGNQVFMNKEMYSIQTTFEPKMGGLQVLDNLMKDKPLKFFVLFSSVSAMIPKLGVGMSDYSAANAFMNYFAEHHRCDRPFRYTSINWPGWSGVGMKWNVSKAYLDTGLKTVSRDEGMDLFSACMGQNECVIMPCVANEALQYEDLMRIDYEKESIPANGQEMIDEIDVFQGLVDLFAKILKMDSAKIDTSKDFAELGVDSIVLQEIVLQIEKMIGHPMDASVLLEYSTIQNLHEYIQKKHGISTIADHKEKEEKKDKHIAQSKQSHKIAIIGMGCKFPQADSLDAYWENLVHEKDCITEIPKERFDVSDKYAKQYEKGKTISKWGGFVNQIEYFDPAYFDLKSDEAADMDPLVRMFLEVSNDAVYNAGYTKNEVSGKKIGVFAGSRAGQYASRLPGFTKHVIAGIGQNFIAANVSHYFNLTGPSVVVDSACSSSLVSVHMACKSILSGESEMAIAGGVDVILNEDLYIMLTEGRALSPDGRCHTFDVKANGFVPGEGCGSIVLKRYEQAMEDGDQIYAVIEGSAINNDGHTMGITTPNPTGQKNVIKNAWLDAEIDPESISCIEAHGTGTMIGDPIELRALTSLLGDSTDEKQYCAIGSVKSNMGHLLSAAGIASIIKMALSIHHHTIPATLHCNQPNVRFEFEESPFYINRQTCHWKKRFKVRRAGISAFGFGGTNAHMVLCNCADDYKAGLRNHQHVIYNKQYYWHHETDKDRPQHHDAHIINRMENLLKIQVI